MKWVKASEPPKKDDRYFVHGRFHPYMSKVIKACIEFSGGIWHMGKGNEIVEYLDESIEGEDRDKELAELKGIHDGEINLKDAAIVELSEEIEKLRGARFQDIKQIERLKGLLRKEYDKGLLALQFRSDTLDKMWEQFSKNNNL